MSRRKNQPKTPTYEGGINGVLARMDARLDPFDFAEDEALPPVDVDLGPLKATMVLRPANDPDQQPVVSTFGRKRKSLRREFAGEPEICCLNGLLIANLRRRSQPEGCADLFIRLWAEESDFLIKHLNLRWLVSSITTFGDHGATEVQRRVGQTVSVLLNTIKLYESERLYSGTRATDVFTGKVPKRDALPLEMDRFAYMNGGLDVNMLGRLWRDAEGDDVIRPLAHHLLNELIHDPATVLRRFQTMRADKLAKQARKARAKAEADPKALTWGLVCTTNAGVDDVLGWVAHHLELGAARIDLYLDAPDPEVEAALAGQDAVVLTACDDAWWRAQGIDRPDAHQVRQSHNATLSYLRSDLNWLGHIDVDEFLLATRSVADQLADWPKDLPVARMYPVEMLVPTDGGPWRHFKKLPAAAGHEKAVVEEICPTFGPHIRRGFLSHSAGKVFARTGIPKARLGIHNLKTGREKLSGMPRMADLTLGHCHIKSWEHFRDRMMFRLERGSYRSKDPESMGVDDILRFLMESEGDAGLRQLFDEMCADTPELRGKLTGYDMLIDHPIDPQAARARVFDTARLAGE